MDSRGLAEQLIDSLFKLTRKKRNSSIDSTPEMTVLMTLWMHEKQYEEGLQPSQISNRIGIKPATVTPLLNKLEGDGLLSREFSKQDRRAVFVSLTEEGKSRCEKVNNMQMYWYETFVEREGAENCRTFIKVLEDLVEFQKNMPSQ